MDLILSFIIFIGAMILCILTGHTMVIALFVGLIAFVITGHRKGFAYSDLVNMGKTGLKDALVVVEVMFIIGFITAIWRSSGTISFFVYYGIKMITPGLFLLITFLLSCLLSYALGTSFGVAGTVGVIFMALARSGGVNEILTAGVILSGVYFGDRGSPVASSAILVAAISGTDILDNVKMMMRTGFVPLLLCLGIYSVFSFINPIQSVDADFLNALQSEFEISSWCLIPAGCMVILPLLHVKIIHAMMASVISGALISIFVQGMDSIPLLKAMFMGYESTGALGEIINGGGLISMIEVVGIVGLSSTYSGIFAGTDMLGGLQAKLNPVIEKIGRFGTMILLSIITVCIFCNQTIASMMCCDIMKRPYEEAGASKSELAMDLENSVILLAPVIPWSIAGTVPLGFLQVGYEAMPLAFLLYLVPACYALQKKVANPFRHE